jgi:DNA-binding NtrC family response regulator
MENLKYKILLVDQPEGHVQHLQKTWNVEVLATSTEQLLPFLKLQEATPDLLVLPYSEQNARLIQESLALMPALKIVMLGLTARPEDAVRALKLGSVDFFSKDLLHDDVKARVWEILEQDKQRVVPVKSSWFRGKSAPLQTLFQEILEYGRYPNLILLGPCGTGKHRVAEMITSTFSPPHKPLMFLNVGAFPPENREQYFWSTLRDIFQKYESEVQGIAEPLYDTFYLRGLETCEPAFLETLLAIVNQRDDRSLISREVKVILGIDRMKTIDTWRTSFQNYKIIRVPTLAERREDIPDLLAAMVARYAQKYGKSIRGIAWPVLKSLLHYQWPGNIREMESLVENMVLIAPQQGILDMSVFPVTLAMVEDGVAPHDYNAVLTIEEARRIFEHDLIDTLSEKIGPSATVALLKVRKNGESPH